MPDLNAKILLIEDEHSQIEVLRYNLNQQGYSVLVAMDGETGLTMALEEQPDLILLDWMLPNLSGIDVCRKLRRHTETRNVPIILLTARSEERDKIHGLDVGADDYVSKPYSVKELMARIGVALRRKTRQKETNILAFGALQIDLEKHLVLALQKRIELTTTEYKLLVTLMQSPGRVFTRAQLLDLVWGVSCDLETRTVDVHIGRLRAVLKSAGCAHMLRTVRGFGYAIEA